MTVYNCCSVSYCALPLLYLALPGSTSDLPLLYLALPLSSALPGSTSALPVPLL